jgi:2Fe-2S ferredoxin
MPIVIVTTRGGEEKIVEAEVGLSLMEALRNGGINEVQAICGGCAACCTCHVYIEHEQLGKLPPLSEQENALLDSSEFRTACSRLSCQIPITSSLDGLKLTVAPET